MHFGYANSRDFTNNTSLNNHQNQMLAKGKYIMSSKARYIMLA